MSINGTSINDTILNITTAATGIANATMSAAQEAVTSAVKTAQQCIPTALEVCNQALEECTEAMQKLTMTDLNNVSIPQVLLTQLGTLTEVLKNNAGSALNAAVEFHKENPYLTGLAFTVLTTGTTYLAYQKCWSKNNSELKSKESNPLSAEVESDPDEPAAQESNEEDIATLDARPNTKKRKNKF